MKFSTVYLLVFGVLIFSGCNPSTGSDELVDTSIPLSSSESATDVDGNLYEVGYNLVDETTENPVVKKFDANGELLWEMEHDNSPVDVRAEVVTIDNRNRPWVVFTLDGGSSSSSYITLKLTSESAFSNVFQSNYGQGGGPLVSMIARINPENGVIERGTFVTAQLNNGNTNKLHVRGIGVADGFVRVQAESAFRPPHTGTTFIPHPEADEFGPCGAFLVQVDFTEALTEIVESDVLTIQDAAALPNTVWNPDCSVK